MGWFSLGKQAAIKGTGKKIREGAVKKIIKGTGKKIRGRMDKDPNIRKGIAKGLKEHRVSESHKMFKETMKKIPHDLTYMKGYLKGK